MNLRSKATSSKTESDRKRLKKEEQEELQKCLAGNMHLINPRYPNELLYAQLPVPDPRTQHPEAFAQDPSVEANLELKLI